MKISHIVKSKSLDSDGRVQKWLKSCLADGMETEVFFLEDRNENGINSIFQSKVYTTSLFYRRFFPQRKGYLFKVIEYAIKVRKYLRGSKSDVIVFHDVQQYFNIFLEIINKNNRRSVWDLHELPHNFLMKYSITKRFLKFLLENVDLVVYTNLERKEYIHSKISYSEKHYSILNNYPDREFNVMGKVPLPEVINDLRPNLPYVLWLGACIKSRNFDTFIEAFELLKNDFNLVILGSVDNEFEDKIFKYKSENIVFQNFVSQDEMIAFIDNAAFSVVLYNQNTANSLFCEPNRLYQLINRKIPVIVGNNPTLCRLVKEYDLGFVLKDDGREYEEMNEKMNKMGEFYEKVSFDKIKNIDLSWESQIKLVLEKINVINR
ncbi:glycosyltransferase family 4 protein [Myroides odoratimimus]|uniref:glycosyltransferase n=1 Tax=Myroides odoratimimus TaxID=76832 RepID=UPI0025767FB8|nr:glycosyltransferase [Myroides odoratimimus]MDM1509304.1 glycosyltransferase family 4 protein [Myroides odoratimimus]MEC4094363.1 glycosyltransferase [Myroides odoratimimus]